RTSRAFESRRRRITIEAHDKPIARRLGLPEQRNMPWVQQIEAAVGEADPEAVAAPADDHIQRVGARDDLVRGVEIPAVGRGVKFARINTRGADLANDTAGGAVPKTPRSG